MKVTFYLLQQSIAVSKGKKYTLMFFGNSWTQLSSNKSNKIIARSAFTVISL